MALSKKNRMETTMSKMRKYLRKPPQKSNKDGRKWKLLYKEAVSRAEQREDDRLSFLRQGSGSPEDTLRRLNVICENDLDREFPLDT